VRARPADEVGREGRAVGVHGDGADGPFGDEVRQEPVEPRSQIAARLRDQSHSVGQERAQLLPTLRGVKTLRA